MFHRRPTVLPLALAALVAGCPAPLSPAPGAASQTTDQDLTRQAPTALGAGPATPVAQFVAANLASGGVSAIGGFGMNQLLGLLDAGGSGQLKEINRKLDTLLVQVSEVQKQLDGLKTLTQALSANTDFQTKVGKLNADITSINYLDEEYKALAALAAAGDADGLKAKQDALKEDLKRDFSNPLKTLQTWNDELVGHGGATEGLIPMWQKVVATKYPKYYHAGIAQASFAQWSYWDAYQARLVLYLSAAIEAGVYPSIKTPDFLARWQKIRTAQLKQLRGVPFDKRTDTLDLSRFGLPDQVTELAALPPGIVLDTRGKRMYADRVSVLATPAQYQANAQKACDIPDRATGLHGWGIPSVADFKALKKLDGNGVTFKDMGFTGNLDVHSYVFWTSNRTEMTPTDYLGVSSGQQGRTKPYNINYVQYMQVWGSDFREVTGRWGDNPNRDYCPDEIHTDTWRDGLALLPVRTVPEAEMAGYVYPLQ